jgi:hypothetical protein
MQLFVPLHRGMFFGQKIPTMHTAAPNIARAGLYKFRV